MRGTETPGGLLSTVHGSVGAVVSAPDTWYDEGLWEGKDFSEVTQLESGQCRTGLSSHPGLFQSALREDSGKHLPDAPSRKEG